MLQEELTDDLRRLRRNWTSLHRKGALLRQCYRLFPAIGSARFLVGVAWARCIGRGRFHLTAKLPSR